MIKSYLLDGKFKEQNFNDFKEILSVIEKNRRNLYELKLDLIIEILDKFGKKIIADKNINTLQGISYISLWLRKENLKSICRLNYLDDKYFEYFRNIENGFQLCAQPRGVVCHWVAGNMPTLSFFSLVQSILSKNGSIVKVPDHNKDIILSLLKNLVDVRVNFEGKDYSGEEILKSLSIISFNHDDYETSKNFSLSADCKIAWGGAQAISAVTALPQKEHCEIISFGPKYSFGVFDKEFIESSSFDQAIDNSVTDIVLFNQMACSSPHVLFFERSKFSIGEIGQRLKNSFEKLPDRLLKQNIPESIVANVINIRAMYLMQDDKEILKSDDLGWTILINKEINLEEPVQGRVIFIKEVDDIDKTINLITRKIQAMIVCIQNPEKREDFAKRATYRGVDRIVSPGKIHNFTLPWDGILTLNRLVRWVIIKDK